MEIVAPSIPSFIKAATPPQKVLKLLTDDINLGNDEILKLKPESTN